MSVLLSYIFVREASRVSTGGRDQWCDPDSSKQSEEEREKGEGEGGRRDARGMKGGAGGMYL